MARNLTKDTWETELAKAESLSDKIEMLIGGVDENGLPSPIGMIEQFPTLARELMKELSNDEAFYNGTGLTIYLKPNALSYFEPKTLEAKYGENGVEMLKNGSIKLRLGSSLISTRMKGSTRQIVRWITVPTTGITLHKFEDIWHLYEKNLEILTLRAPNKETQKSKKEKN